MDLLISFFVFLFGICIGSFLNVCIYRWPREKSVVKPASHCPGCEKPVAWYDNIPLLSFVLLSGKCRHCKTKISSRYFFVELVNGVLWLWLFSKYGLSAKFYAGAIYFSILFAVSVTDLETGYIPDNFTLPGMVIGLVCAALAPQLFYKEIWYQGLLSSFWGLLFGGGILLMIGLIGNLIFRKESMGGGDIKLLAMMGAFIGLKNTVYVLLFAPILAIPFALFAKLFKKAETIPFGPYLALSGGWLYVYGDWFSETYFLL